MLQLLWLRRWFARWQPYIVRGLGVFSEVPLDLSDPSPRITFIHDSARGRPVVQVSDRRVFSVEEIIDVCEEFDACAEVDEVMYYFIDFLDAPLLPMWIFHKMSLRRWVEDGVNMPAILPGRWVCYTIRPVRFDRSTKVLLNDLAHSLIPLSGLIQNLEWRWSPKEPTERYMVVLRDPTAEAVAVDLMRERFLLSERRLIPGEKAVIVPRPGRG